jgi:uncharacterized membrane protein YeaQ/YmgE (transglycosylase-associated protein family)
MTLVELLILVVVAGIIGSLGQALAGYYIGGCFISIIVGFIGAFLGVWLARELNLPELLVITIDDNAFPVVWSIIGATLFVAIIGLFTRRPVVY